MIKYYVGQKVIVKHSGVASYIGKTAIIKEILPNDKVMILINVRGHEVSRYNMSSIKPLSNNPIINLMLEVIR